MDLDIIEEKTLPNNKTKKTLESTCHIKRIDIAIENNIALKASSEKTIF